MLESTLRKTNVIGASFRVTGRVDSTIRRTGNILASFREIQPSQILREEITLLLSDGDGFILSDGSSLLL